MIIRNTAYTQLGKLFEYTIFKHRPDKYVFTEAGGPLKKQKPVGFCFLYYLETCLNKLLTNLFRQVTIIL